MHLNHPCRISAVVMLFVMLSASAQFQTTYPALDQAALNKAVPMTDGGFWLMQNLTMDQSGCHLIRFDGSGVAMRAMHVGHDVSSMSFWPSMVATTDGGAVAIFPQEGYEMIDGMPVHRINIPAIAFDENGDVLWQKRFSTLVVAQTNVYGSPVSMATDQLGNVFMVISCGSRTEVVCLNGEDVVWWTSCNAGIYGMNGCIADGMGGCYAMIGGLTHFDGTGSATWSRSLAMSDAPAYLWMTTAQGPNNTLRMVHSGDGTLVRSVELSPLGDVLSASSYGPFPYASFMPEFRAVGQANGSTVIISTSGLYITLQADGEVGSVYRSPIGWTHIQHEGDRIMLSTVKGYFDPEFEDPLYAAVVWDAQQDMSQYCTLEELSASRTVVPLTDINVGMDIPYNAVQAVDELPLSFAITSIPLPEPLDYCTTLAPMLATNIAVHERLDALEVVPTVLTAGGTITVRSSSTGSIHLISATGELVHDLSIKSGEMLRIGTGGSAPGLYGVRSVDTQGHVVSVKKIVIE